MTNLIKTTLVALAILSGAASVQAGDDLMDAAATGSSVTSQGFLSGR